MASPHPQWASKYTQISDSSTQKVVFSSDTMKKKRERKEKEKEKKKEEGEKKTPKIKLSHIARQVFLVSWLWK